MTQPFRRLKQTELYWRFVMTPDGDAIKRMKSNYFKEFHTAAIRQTYEARKNSYGHKYPTYYLSGGSGYLPIHPGSRERVFEENCNRIEL
jgi:hypothetical protein